MTPFDQPRVIHAPYNRLSRCTALCQHECIQSDAHMPVSYSRHKTLNLLRSAVPRVHTHPQAAVTLPTHPRVSWITLRLVHRVEGLVDRSEECLTICHIVSGAKVIGMFVRSDVETLLSSCEGNTKQTENE